MKAAIPRRLEPTDRNFNKLAGHLQVFLDGALVQRCRAYDLNAGTVRVLKVAAAGHPLRTRLGLVEETLTGRVEVEWRAC
jgi:hypothetical protein